MRELALILAAAAVTYVTRLSGFALGRWHMPRALDLFLGYVPVAVFATLIVPGLGFGTEEMPYRLLGAVAAGLIVARTSQLWAGLAVGMAAYWLARAYLPL